MLFKKLYEKLVTNVSVIDTCGFVWKTQYNNDKSGLENKTDDAHKEILDTSGLVKKQIRMQRLLM